MHGDCLKTVVMNRLMPPIIKGGFLRRERPILSNQRLLELNTSQKEEAIINQGN